MSRNRTSIGFADDLIPLIQNHTKTFTYRIGNKYDFLCPGDIIDVRSDPSGDIVGKIKIINTSFTTFKELPIDRVGHEIYLSKEAQRSVLETYYGKVTDNDKILVLEFEVV